MSVNKKNLIGQVFGNLTVIAEAARIPNKSTSGSRAAWLCRCVCRKEVPIKEYYLLCGDTKSCGCLKKEAASRNFKKFVAKITKYATRREANAASIYNNRYSQEGDTITLEDFFNMSQENCFYCGKPPSTIGKTISDKEEDLFIYNGLDRIISNSTDGTRMPHSKENCVPCCWPCNRAKSTKTQKEYISIIANIYNELIISEKDKDEKVSIIRNKGK